MVAWWFKDDSGQEFEQDIGDENISDFLKSQEGGRLSAVRQSDYTDSPWKSQTKGWSSDVDKAESPFKNNAAAMMQSGDPNMFQAGQGVQPAGWGDFFGGVGDAITGAGEWIGDKAQDMWGAVGDDREKFLREKEWKETAKSSGYGEGTVAERQRQYVDYWDQFMAGGSGRNEALVTDPNTGKTWSTPQANVHGGFDSTLGGTVDDEALYQQGEQRSGGLSGEQIPIPFGGSIPDFTQEADIDPDNPAKDPGTISGFLDPDATSWEDKDWHETPPPKGELDTDNDGDLEGNDMLGEDGKHDPNKAQEVISRVVYDAPDYQSAIDGLNELIETIPPDDYASRTAAFQAVGQLYLESVRGGKDLEAERIAANPFGITSDQFIEEQRLGRKAPLDIATQDRLGREAQFNADQARLTADAERDRSNRLSVAEQGRRMAEAQEGGMIGASKAQFNPFDLGATPGKAYATGEVDEFGEPVMHQPLSGPQQQQQLARGGLTTEQRLAEITAQGRPDMINSILGLLGNPAAMGSLQGLFGGAEGKPMQNQNFPAIPTISSLRNSPETTLQFLQGLFGTQGVNPDQLQNLIRSVSPGGPGGGGQQRQQLGSSF